MKKIISKILVASLAVSLFSTTAFAYKLEVSDQLEISNIITKDDRVFALDDELNPIQTYLAQGVVNFVAVGENLEQFSVSQILPVDGYWTPIVDMPYAYGGMIGEASVEPYSVVSISEGGLYYVTSQKDGVTNENVIYIQGDQTYNSNAFMAEFGKVSVTVDDTEYNIDVYEVCGDIYFKIRDIAQMLSTTQKGFEITWNTDFELIDIYREQDYTPTGSELIKNGNEQVNTVAIDDAPDLFLETRSTRIQGYIINDENFYNIEKIADLLDFSIDINLKQEYISIDTSNEYLPS